jgi:hypothetical protein
MMDRRKLLLVAATASLLGAPTAHAQVFVDPGSPSGKEYAIPLESARRSAATGQRSDTVAQGERSAPLFGEGIGDGGKKGGGGQPQASGSAQQQPTRAGRGDGVRRALRDTTPVSAAVPNSGAGGLASVGGVALSVLLLGAVIGSIARRRQS